MGTRMTPSSAMPIGLSHCRNIVYHFLGVRGYVGLARGEECRMKGGFLVLELVSRQASRDEHFRYQKTGATCNVLGEGGSVKVRKLPSSRPLVVIPRLMESVLVGNRVVQLCRDAASNGSGSWRC
jgi:hypothetical protein